MLPFLQKQLHYVNVVSLSASIANNASGMSGFCPLCISIFPAHFFNFWPNWVPSYSRSAAFCGNSEFSAARFTCEQTKADVTSLSLRIHPRHTPITQVCRFSNHSLYSTLAFLYTKSKKSIINQHSWAVFRTTVLS